MRSAILEELWRLSKKRSFIQSANLLDKLYEATGIAIPDIKAELKRLSKEEAIKGISSSGIPLGRINILVQPPQKGLSEIETTWRSVLLQHGYEENDIPELLKCAEYFDGMSEVDMGCLLEGIKQIRENLESLIMEDHFIVSAQYLLGSSKALEAIGAAFRVLPSMFLGRPQYIVVAGPSEPTAVLLIENPSSFERVCSTSVIEKVMAIVTFGYGLSWSGIAEAIKERNKFIPLLRAGSPGIPPAFENVISSLPIFFWGDLDREGLSIYLQLRQKIPTLMLSALYYPMLKAIEDPSTSHSYCSLAGAKKPNQRQVVTEDPLVAKLAALCKDRAVDQEIVRSEDIKALYNKGLKVEDVEGFLSSFKGKNISRSNNSKQQS